MKITILLGCLSTLIAISGCDWVDSTGKQSGTASTPIMLDGVAPGEAKGLDENLITPLITRASGVRGEATYEWQEMPADEPVETCNAIEGFRSEIAVTSLSAACTNADDCSIAIEQVASEEAGSVTFNVRVPPLKAPIGIRRQLSISTLDDAVISREFDLCLIAINEAPDAMNDGPYEMVEGSTLIVGDDEPNLIANDTDDVDDGNLPELAIRVEPHTPPKFASAFEILADGSFRYSYPESELIEPVDDSFEYDVTDGELTSTARVDIHIVAGNRTPVLESAIEPIVVAVDSLVGVDLSGYFSDPEGLPLSFSADEATLPASRSLALTSDGVLRGFPVDADIGDYDVTIVTSDGERELFTQVALSVLPPTNSAPEYIDGTVGNVLVDLGVAIEPVSPNFIDPDGDTLVYELLGVVPRGIVIDSETGVVTGSPRLRGIFAGLIIRATDPDGASADSERFMVRVY